MLVRLEGGSRDLHAFASPQKWSMTPGSRNTYEIIGACRYLSMPIFVDSFTCQASLFDPHHISHSPRYSVRSSRHRPHNLLSTSSQPSLSTCHHHHLLFSLQPTIPKQQLHHGEYRRTLAPPTGTHASDLNTPHHARTRMFQTHLQAG